MSTSPNPTPVPQPAAPQAPAGSSWGRRIAAALGIGVILFFVLWTVVFHAVTAALVSGGMILVLVAVSAVSSVFEGILEIVAGVLAAIAAIFAGLFSIFN